MVNKTVLGIAVLLVLASFGGGIFVGMQLGGQDAEPQTDSSGSDSGGGDDGGAAQTSTATPTKGSASNGSVDNGTATNETTPDGTATATPTPTPVETEQEAYVPPRYYSESKIAAHVAEFINEERQQRRLDPMSPNGNTADRIAVMAEGHSDAMAAEGRTVHEIDGVDSADRYRQSDLYSACTFQAAGKSYVRYPDGNNFEAIDRTVAGQVYTEDGQEQFNAGNREVARAIVDSWFDTQPYRDRLTYANAARMGIGINVTDSGDVYATANICG
ncbi:CAP domain-containing protein [Haloarcula marina]|uniref:CAP domain-containing protein n=1 Tax=Haloarcula marina TaxID=2961574 RepID=UPI0020B76115|nr:CAP domain-containing protein [Halomicroarcula marina]